MSSFDDDKTVVGSGDSTEVAGSSSNLSGDKTTVATPKRVKSASPTSLNVPSRIGKYVNIRPLGAGGMGAVFLGDDKELDRVVVIKTLLKSGKARKARFLREAGILSGLTSQRIVRFYETIEEGNNEYVVLEYVEGMDLSKLIAKDGKLPVQLAVWILKEVCLGLRLPHRQKIVHRDIKPANILLAKGANVKITDFGISGMEYDEDEEEEGKVKKRPLSSARIISNGITMESVSGGNASMGTLNYMAPEQMEDVHGSDIRADIYSLGVMLYEMVTGTKPYTEQSMADQYQKISSGKYISPSKLTKKLPLKVRYIIAKCLKFKREKRFSSVEPIIRICNSYLKKFDEKEIRQQLANSMHIKPTSQYKYEVVENKNKKRYIITAIVLGVIALGVGIFMLIRAGYYTGYWQRGMKHKEGENKGKNIYTPVNIELNFPQYTIAGSGFSPKAYYYTYDDSDPKDVKIAGVKIEKKINPYATLVTIPDSTNLDDRSLDDVVPSMDFTPDKDNPNIYSTKTMFLEPGNYRIKICMGPTVWWETVSVGEYNPKGKKGKTGEVYVEPGYSLSEGKKVSFGRPKVFDRQTGEDITEDCTFAVDYSGAFSETVSTIPVTKNRKTVQQKLTADDVEALAKDKWVSVYYTTKKDDDGNVIKEPHIPIIHVYVYCSGYQSERFGLSMDWYQDKIYIQSALKKK